jgi:hypothetical protein
MALLRRDSYAVCRSVEEDPFMLICHSKRGETVTIELSDDIDPCTPIGEVLAGQGISVELAWTGNGKASLRVDVPPGLNVVGSDLSELDQAAATGSATVTASAEAQTPANDAPRALAPPFLEATVLDARRPRRPQVRMSRLSR